MTDSNSNAIADTISALQEEPGVSKDDAKRSRSSSENKGSGLNKSLITLTLVNLLAIGASFHFSNQKELVVDESPKLSMIFKEIIEIKPLVENLNGDIAAIDKRLNEIVSNQKSLNDKINEVPSFEQHFESIKLLIKNSKTQAQHDYAPAIRDLDHKIKIVGEQLTYIQEKLESSVSVEPIQSNEEQGCRYKFNRSH